MWYSEWFVGALAKETVQEIKRLGVGSFQSVVKNTLCGTDVDGVLVRGTL